MNKETIEYNKYLNKLAVTRNITSLICFTALAIAFNKWWLVLLSLMFFSYTEKEG